MMPLERGTSARSSCIVLLSLIAGIAGAGCAINYYYTPGVYEIAEGRIAPVDCEGGLEITSIQAPDPGRAHVLHDAITAVWYTDRAVVSEALANQLSSELRSNGCRIGSPAGHTMTVAVPDVTVVQAGVKFAANLTVKVALDGAPERGFDIQNESSGNIWRTVNGGIAVAVIDILSDPEVREWLARKPADLPPS